MNRHTSQSSSDNRARVPVRVPAWIPWLAIAAFVPAAMGVALAILMDPHVAFTSVGIYLAGLGIWALLEAIGGRSARARPALLVLALGIVTGTGSDNHAVALTLTVLGMAGVALEVPQFVAKRRAGAV